MGMAEGVIEKPSRVPMLIEGQWVFGSVEYEVSDPFRGGVVARAPNSTAADLNAAISAAVAAKAEAAAMPGYKRAEILHRVGALLAERAETIAQIMSR